MITKELLETQLRQEEAEYEIAIASANKIAGAINALKWVLRMMEMEEKKEEPRTGISDKNAEIQRMVEEAEEEAVELADIAKAVGGEGATYTIEELPASQPDAFYPDSYFGEK